MSTGMTPKSKRGSGQLVSDGNAERRKLNHKGSPHVARHKVSPRQAWGAVDLASLIRLPLPSMTDPEHVDRLKRHGGAWDRW